MARDFPQTMALLRREKGVSQRTAAGALGISQALLSHYENGAREPGIPFIRRACEYYGVTADYMLGLSDDRAAGGAALGELLGELRALTAKYDTAPEDEK